MMTCVWLLAQMRQPCRPLYSDLTGSTFTRFLTELLSAKNFLLDREVAGQKLRVPRWGLPRPSAPHGTLDHSLLTISNASYSSSTSSTAVQPTSEITELRKDVAELKKLQKQNNRSRSPRGRALTNHDQPLAITDASKPSKGKGKGKQGKGKGGKPPAAARRKRCLLLLPL